jgi:DNA-binding IclR family transcriptional regulator
MVRFARVLESQMHLRDVALEHFTELRDRVNETVNILQLDHQTLARTTKRL